MTITSAVYAQADQSVINVVRDGKTRTVPADPANRDYRAVLAWIADGNSVGAYVAPAPPTADKIYDAVIQTERVLRAVVLSINDGTLGVGANQTPVELKAIIKANM